MIDIINSIIHFTKPISFYSAEFWVIFTIFLALVYILSFNTLVRNSLILLFNIFFFYKLTGGNGLLILLIIAFSDLIFSNLMARSEGFLKNSFKITAILIALGSLVFFKYTYFFLQVYEDLTGIKLDLGLEIVKPLGISYLVFRSISYIIDVYDEVIPAEKNPVNYLSYILFFPTIIAGPIHRAEDFLPQLKQKGINLDYSKFKLALFLFSTGFFKKIIADQLGLGYVDRMFSQPDLYSGTELFMSGVVYSFQLFLDFCGYTDMAVALALLLGFEIPHNFRSPFKAISISDFWRRWHITLSTWLQDYLFLPLEFSMRRLKIFATILAAIITFLLSGLWHGPKYTYVLWGLSHGIIIAWEIATKKLQQKIKSKIKFYTKITWFLTFIYLIFTFIIFRAEDIKSLNFIFTKIFTDFNFILLGKWFSAYGKIASLLGLAFVMHFIPDKIKDNLISKWTKYNIWVVFILTLTIIIITLQLRSMEAQEFIYLKF